MKGILMPHAKRRAAQQRYQREADILCAHCYGTGRVTAESVSARAQRGGNASFLVSLQPGRLSMSERGRRGGRPMEPTLGDLAAMGRGTGTT